MIGLYLHTIVEKLDNIESHEVGDIHQLDLWFIKSKVSSS